MAESKSGKKPVYESQESLYQKAVKKLEADALIVQPAYKVYNYQLAADMFEEVGDYLDAPAQARLCRDAAKRVEDEAKESLYETAMYRKAHARSTDEVKRLVEEFEKLGDYKDAKAQAEDCRTQAEKAAGKRRRTRVSFIAVVLAIAGGLAAFYFSGLFEYLHGYFYYKNGQYSAAAKVFETMPGYLKSDEYLDVCTVGPLLSADIGNDVSYGKYKWKILTREDGIVTMIASDIGNKHIFHSAAFHNKQEAVTWKDSSLRKWLNGEVLQTIFDEKQRERLIVQESVPSVNEDYGTKYEDVTADYLTLLTPEDTRRDEYKRKISEIGHNYWLRTPGNSMDTAVFIDSTHTVRTYGSPVTDQTMVVRPVIKVDCTEEMTAAEESRNLLEQNEELVPCETEDRSEDIAAAVSEADGAYKTMLTADVGKDIPFGRYTWKLLKREGTVATLIASSVGKDHPFFAVAFNDEEGETSWADSSLRAWLNGEALDLFFNKEERSHLVLQKTETSVNTEYGTSYSGITEDYMTLLSIEEAQNINIAAQLATLSRNFWLRAPGHDMSSVAYMDGEHMIRTYGTPANDATIMVRPVIQVQCLGN